MSEWEKIETAPDDALMLVAVKLRVGWFFAVAQFGDTGSLEDQDGTYLGYENTDADFWMPLPDPPTEDE